MSATSSGKPKTPASGAGPPKDGAKRLGTPASGTGAGTRANPGAVEPADVSSNDGPRKLRDSLLSKIKDPATATGWLDRCGLWGTWSDGSATPQLDGAYRVLLKLAVHAKRKDNELSESLLSVAIIVDDVAQKIARGGDASTPHSLLSPELAAAIRSEVASATRTAFKGTTVGDDGQDDDDSVGLLDAIKEQLDTHHSHLTGIFNAESTKVVGMLESAREVVLERVSGLATASTKPLYSHAHLGAGVSSDRMSGRTPAQHDAMARATVRERQILIDADPGIPAAWVKDGRDDLIQKATMALAAAETACPPDARLATTPTVEAMTRLRNGGIVYELNSSDSADWLRKPDVRALFLSSFDPSAVLRDRAHPVLLKNVPVELDVTSADFLRRIETANKLPELCLLRAQWMKPEQRRRAGQQNAHLRVLVATAEAANAMIGPHLRVERMSIAVERLTPDALRCARCQRFGHMAKECKGKETCGNCAHEHPPQSCYTPEGTQCCANCKDVPGADARHPAWSRDCPERLLRLEQMRARRPDDFTEYFLTSTNHDSLFPRMQPSVPIREAVPQGAAKRQRRAVAASRAKTASPAPPKRGRSTSASSAKRLGRQSSTPRSRSASRGRGGLLNAHAAAENAPRRSSRSGSRPATYAEDSDSDTDHAN